MVRRSATRAGEKDGEEMHPDTAAGERGSDDTAQVEGAIGGLVGSDAPQEGIPVEVRDQLSPFIRQIIRDEVRGLLDMHPMGEMNVAAGNYPLGRGAVPRRVDRGHEEDLPMGGSGQPAQASSSARGSSCDRTASNHSQGTSGAYRPPPLLTPIYEDQGHHLRNPAPGVDEGRNLELREDLGVKITPFNPKEVEWYAYRTHFISLANQANWSERTRTTKLMAALQGSMVGVTAGLPQPIAFADLLARVDQIHGLGNAREGAALRLQVCRMENHESVSLFAERVRQLVTQAYPTYTPEDREEQALRVFLQGLPNRDDLRMQMRVRRFATLREAAEYGAMLEQIIKDEKSREGRKPHARNVTVSDQSELIKAIEKFTKEITRMQQEAARNQGNGYNSQGLRGSGNGYQGSRRDQGERRQGSGARNPDNSPCLLCGQLGHWCRECPLNQAQANAPGNGQGNGPNGQGPHRQQPRGQGPLN